MVGMGMFINNPDEKVYLTEFGTLEVETDPKGVNSVSFLNTGLQQNRYTLCLQVVDDSDGRIKNRVASTVATLLA